METITPNSVRERFPEFDITAYPDSIVAFAIADATEISSFSQSATLHLVAHLLVLAGQQTPTADGGSGIVTSEAIGDRSVDYLNQAEKGSDAFYLQTAYGRKFLILERRSHKLNFSARVL